ncbi:MAG TPA: hypothetical protein PK762_06910 [Candidatus Kapabacteria bacterium]|nr:hypothetical protein [Candidatus Kapabacteria bacterium]
MKRFSIFILILSSILFVSCSSVSKIQTSKVKPYEIKELQKFKTISYVELIESGNDAVFNDSISKKSENALSEALMNYKDKISLKGEIIVNDTFLQKQIELEISFLYYSIDAQDIFSTLKITPKIDSLLESKGKRFGLITIVSGFTRAKGNYGAQIAKGIGMGIATLGFYSETPIESYSNLCIMIVDSKENNIAFFRKSSLKEEEPYDSEVLKKQIFDIFEGYFW